jgi:hypothetical protein
MKKITQVGVFFLFNLIGLFSLQAQNITPTTNQNVGINSNNLTSTSAADANRMFACDGVLPSYSNLTFDGGGIASQDFEAANDAFDCQAGDSFIVPGSDPQSFVRSIFSDSTVRLEPQLIHRPLTDCGSGRTTVQEYPLRRSTPRTSMLLHWIRTTTVRLP